MSDDYGGVILSGIDEQNRIGIKCKWCDAQGSFVHTGFNKLLDVHLHGERIYISTREDTPPNCEMFTCGGNTS